MCTNRSGQGSYAASSNKAPADGCFSSTLRRCFPGKRVVLSNYLLPLALMSSTSIPQCLMSSTFIPQWYERRHVTVRHDRSHVLWSHVYMYTHLNPRAHAHTHARTHTHVRTHMHTDTHTHMYTRAHTHTHTRTRAHIYAHTYTYTHVHPYIRTRRQMVGTRTLSATSLHPSATCCRPILCVMAHRAAAAASAVPLPKAPFSMLFHSLLSWSVCVYVCVRSCERARKGECVYGLVECAVDY